MRSMTRWIACLLALLIYSGLSFGAPAAEEMKYTPPQAPPALDAGPMLLRLFGMTLFVLLLCAGVLWGVRLVRRPRLAGLTNPDRLRSLGEVSLASRCSIHLLQAGNNHVLIAVDAGGVKTCQLVDESFAAALTNAGVPAREPRQGQGPSVAEVMSLLAASRAA